MNPRTTILTALGNLTLAGFATAQLTTFTPNTPALASQVNGNFTTVQSLANAAQSTASTATGFAVAAQSTASSALAGVNNLQPVVTNLSSGVAVNTTEVIVANARRLTFLPNIGNAALNPRKIELYRYGDNDHQFIGFGTSSNQLQYQLENTTSSHVFRTGSSPTTSTELMRIQGNGNVGIGTSTPGSPLHVSFPSGDIFRADGTYSRFTTHSVPPSAGTTVAAILSSPAAPTQLRFYKDNAPFVDIGQDASSNFVVETNDIPRLTVQQNGIVSIGTALTVQSNGGAIGIGTANPTRGQLEIANGPSGQHTVNGYGYLDRTGASVSSSSGIQHQITLWAQQTCAARDFVAFSDARIKRIEGRSDAAQDLARLQAIEVADYTHIDTIANGSGKQKKVIAQQVEAVFPQAVKRSTDVVPDIYQRATIKDGWVSLATNLQKGERVRLIGAKTEGVHEVLEVTAEGFRTAFAADDEAVFVYGREVNDFRSVDYTAVAMLNVSATQELARQVVAKDRAIVALQGENDDLRQRLEALEAAVAQLQPQFAARK